MSATDPSTPTDSEPSLSVLPVELLLNIVGHLKNCDDSRGSKTLFKLSAVSRQFRRIATPFAYETFDTRAGDPFKFLRTLLEYPELRAHVKCISWGEDISVLMTDDLEDVDEIIENRYPHDVADGTVIVSKLRESDLPSAIEKAHRYEVRLESERIDWIDNIFLESVLLLTPNLSTFEFQTVGFSKRQDMIPWKTLMRYRVGHGFVHLRKVKITVTGAPSMHLGPIFAHQSLREFELVNLVAFGGQDLDVPPRCSNIEILTMRGCLCSGPKLASYISSCRKLKIFLYEHCYTPWSELISSQLVFFVEPDLDFIALESALRSHRQSLQHLAILDGRSDWVDAQRSPLGALRDFECLQ